LPYCKYNVAIWLEALWKTSKPASVVCLPAEIWTLSFLSTVRSRYSPDCDVWAGEWWQQNIVADSWKVRKKTEGGERLTPSDVGKGCGWNWQSFGSIAGTEYV